MGILDATYKDVHFHTEQSATIVFHTIPETGKTRGKKKKKNVETYEELKSRSEINTLLKLFHTIE